MAANSNVILLYGNDEYAISQRVREFEAMFSGTSEAEMNTAHLDARTMTEQDLHNAVNTAPFLAAHRLVLLANPSKRYVEVKPEDKPGGKADPPARAEARKKFLELISSIPSTTKLVMWDEIEVKSRSSRAGRKNEDEKHWLVKFMIQSGLGLERYALPEAREMTAWIIKNAKSQGGEIGQTAATKLAETVGIDPRQAAQEITKLLAYVNWSRPVTAADVEALSPVTAAPDIFAMVDALGAGEVGLAQRLLHRLLESQDAFSTWGMIVRQFRLLLLAREVLDGGGGEAEAASAMGVPPFVARKTLGQARGFTLAALERIYHRLLEVDEQAKTGGMPLELGMEMLVLELRRI